MHHESHEAPNDPLPAQVSKQVSGSLNIASFLNPPTAEWRDIAQHRTSKWASGAAGTVFLVRAWLAQHFSSCPVGALVFRRCEDSELVRMVG